MLACFIWLAIKILLILTVPIPQLYPAMYRALVDRILTKATKGQSAICPHCGSQMIAKCGKLNVDHWVEKPANLTPFRQLNLTPGSRDRLTPSFLTTTAKNFS